MPAQHLHRGPQLFKGQTQDLSSCPSAGGGQQEYLILRQRELEGERERERVCLHMCVLQLVSVCVCVCVWCVREREWSAMESITCCSVCMFTHLYRTQISSSSSHHLCSMVGPGAKRNCLYRWDIYWS